VFSALPTDPELYVDPSWAVEAEAAAGRYVDSLTTRLCAAGVAATGEVTMSRSVADAIVNIAKERAADLIVMSTQALSNIARAVSGSTADAVVRTAQCPVLVLHRTSGPDNLIGHLARQSTKALIDVNTERGVPPHQQSQELSLTVGRQRLPVPQRSRPPIAARGDA
jgi:hypothetical protein